ncbi:MAG TPA: NUDIX hydrolase [Streptosporangiaceae bacterium]|nr:NUDIX hydrolase [Streptosporangiaceae bacterium]
MPETGFTEPDVWFAGLPGVVIAAGALVTDPDGRVLLVKPNYRELWSLPGGICEFGEAPHAGAAREVAEEVGLEVPIGQLLALDWSRPYGPEARPIMHFIFDGGQIADSDSIVVQESELEGFRFTAPDELPVHLPPRGFARVAGALRALESGTLVFLPHEISSPD